MGALETLCSQKEKNIGQCNYSKKLVCKSCNFCRCVGQNTQGMAWFSKKIYFRLNSENLLKFYQINEFNSKNTKNICSNISFVEYNISIFWIWMRLWLVQIVVKIWTMRFYYLDPKKIYTLNEFIQEQTIKKNIVDLDISQVFINTSFRINA